MAIPVSTDPLTDIGAALTKLVGIKLAILTMATPDVEAYLRVGEIEQQLAALYQWALVKYTLPA